MIWIRRLALKYEFITYEFVLYISWCKERTETLTLDVADWAEVEWEVVDAVGGMVNVSTSTKEVREVNEKRFRWLSAKAECITDSEGGAFLAMTDVWIQWWRWMFLAAIDRRYEVMCWVERKRGRASRWWWQMVCGDVSLMWQQVRTNKRSFREKMEY